ncbi:IclR family transcriptional regulator [Ornithinimicrobium sp. W1665]|uniref:IclR family transcriptional regulator n=1 Tax=Ornithinimicrobium sp. W1665 TaxID=3416666 RepID=UPI003CF7A653
MQLITRIASILKYLASRPDGATLLQITVELGLPMSTLHRLLASLEDEHFVTRVGKVYVLGPDAIGLSRGIRYTAQVAKRHLHALTSETGETTFLTEFLGERAVCVAISDGPGSLRLFVRVGEAMPLHAAASARAILAFRPDEEVQALLSASPMTMFTPKTPVTVEEVAEDLSMVRRMGYDLCDEELDPAVVAISAPVFDAHNEVIASVTVAAPKTRCHGERRTDTIDALMRHTGAICRELGHLPMNVDTPTAAGEVS